MLGFNALLGDTISILKGEKWSHSREVIKKEVIQKRHSCILRKKYLKLLICIQLACVCKGWLWPLGEEVKDHCKIRWLFNTWSLLTELDLMCTVMGVGPRDVRGIWVGCRCAEQLFWMCCWILVRTSLTCSESQKYYQFFFLFLFAKLSWTFG